MSNPYLPPPSDDFSYYPSTPPQSSTITAPISSSPSINPYNGQNSHIINSNNPQSSYAPSSNSLSNVNSTSTGQQYRYAPAPSSSSSYDSKEFPPPSSSSSRPSLDVSRLITSLQTQSPPRQPQSLSSLVVDANPRPSPITIYNQNNAPLPLSIPPSPSPNDQNNNNNFSNPHGVPTDFSSASPTADSSLHAVLRKFRLHDTQQQNNNNNNNSDNNISNDPNNRTNRRVTLPPISLPRRPSLQSHQQEEKRPLSTKEIQALTAMGMDPNNVEGTIRKLETEAGDIEMGEGAIRGEDMVGNYETNGNSAYNMTLNNNNPMMIPSNPNPNVPSSTLSASVPSTTPSVQSLPFSVSQTTTDALSLPQKLPQKLRLMDMEADGNMVRGGGNDNHNNNNNQSNTSNVHGLVVPTNPLVESYIQSKSTGKFVKINDKTLKALNDSSSIENQRREEMGKYHADTRRVDMTMANALNPTSSNMAQSNAHSSALSSPTHGRRHHGTMNSHVASLIRKGQLTVDPATGGYIYKGNKGGGGGGDGGEGEGDIDDLVKGVTTSQSFFLYIHLLFYSLLFGITLIQVAFLFPYLSSTSPTSSLLIQFFTLYSAYAVKIGEITMLCSLYHMVMSGWRCWLESGYGDKMDKMYYSWYYYPYLSTPSDNELYTGKHHILHSLRGNISDHKIRSLNIFLAVLSVLILFFTLISTPFDDYMDYNIVNNPSLLLTAPIDSNAYNLYLTWRNCVIGRWICVVSGYLIWGWWKMVGSEMRWKEGEEREERRSKRDGLNGAKGRKGNQIGVRGGGAEDQEMGMINHQQYQYQMNNVNVNNMMR